MADFDDEFYMDEDDDEFSPFDEFSTEDIAEIKRASQDANMGFTYEFLKTEEGRYVFKCNKCGRSAGIDERPFPHKFECPMRNM